jgi:probable HAF family extracellular repeat protein
MKMNTAPVILIIAGLGFPQLILGQQPIGDPTKTVLGTFVSLPGLGRVQAINNAGQILAQTGGGDNVQGLLLNNPQDPTQRAAEIAVPGSKQTLVYGMDNSTRIVGAYDKSDDSGAHGFLLVNGETTTIDFPGGTDTRARSINDLMQIVGDYKDSIGHRHGFLRNNGNFTPINVSGAVNTYVYGINRSGTIVGSFTDSQGHQHGFLSDNTGVIRTIDVPFPGATDTFLYGINSLGIIVGSYIDSAGTHGFADISGAFVSIDAPDTPPGIGTFARSINDSGQIIIYGTIAFLTFVRLQ